MFRKCGTRSRARAPTPPLAFPTRRDRAVAARSAVGSLRGASHRGSTVRSQQAIERCEDLEIDTIERCEDLEIDREAVRRE